jgi:RpiB/LacA/LacB family sugar-phosphate isomerase
MHVAVASDHAGFHIKTDVATALRSAGHDVIDLGTCDETPVDYPDYAEKLGQAVVEGRVERGVLVCGSGVGASVAANKIPGVRAGLCHDTYSAHQGVEHDDMNVLVLGGRVIGSEVAKELAHAFVSARYTHEERHERRLAKVRAIETHYAALRADSLSVGQRSAAPSDNGETT